MWETRAGSGTPVVLIHGLAGSSRWWSRNIDVLAERHLVAAVDLIGFGHWKPRAIPELLPPFAEVTTLLARWLETFGEPVHLVGHSMGGHLAIRLAAERPDLVRSLVLVNAAGIPFGFHPLQHLKPLPKPPFGGMRIARVLVPDALRAGPTSVAVASARVLAGDAREWMRALRLPTLLIWGENDPLIPLPYGEAMQQEIAESRLVVVPRAAHVAMWDNAQEFNRIVTEWLDEVEAAPPCDVAPGAFCWGVAGWTDGMAHRQAGRRRDLVLLHGLGMSSAYFVRFARALYERGWNPIAPDLPGFGESDNAPSSGPREHAEILARWADALSIRDAVWVGHSIGCNAVAHLKPLRPDVVREAVCLGPLWSRDRHPIRRLMVDLVVDAFREPLSLYRYVLRAYWRAGLWRWWRTFRKYLPDVAGTPPARVRMLAGARDPIPDVARTRELDPEARLDLPGAHACHFSHPEGSADAL